MVCNVLQHKPLNRLIQILVFTDAVGILFSLVLSQKYPTHLSTLIKEDVPTKPQYFRINRTKQPIKNFFSTSLC